MVPFSSENVGGYQLEGYHRAETVLFDVDTEDSITNVPRPQTSHPNDSHQCPPGRRL